ncbi:MAG: hypothetical protein A2Y65_00965 [Deltaproteobacteria bacterium RBG_13_52_11]|nr:MAG: hypothetical protein A2Y65_00965 [Deltaproteobacteria bacterium RBG_13_52_11]
MVNELTEALQRSGVLLGFASMGIAFAYIGSLLAFLLCFIYGLIRWNQGRRAHRAWSLRFRGRPRVRGARRGRRAQKGRGQRNRRVR